MKPFFTRLKFVGVVAVSAVFLLVASCGGSDDNDAPTPNLAARTVYTMTNAATGNEVIAFRRAEDGTLSRIAAYATGGNGLGSTEISPATPQDGVDVLASQGSLFFTPNKRVLLAVNAASHSVSSFLVSGDGTLTRADVKPSGGRQPNAIGAHNDLVYVANVGDTSNSFASNISGFTLDGNGVLTPIAGSTRSLSTPNAQPASVAFHPNGNLIAVSELTANRISVFPVGAGGTIGAPVVNASAGPGPFGSSFLSNGRLFVTEAPMGASGATSSYNVSANGTLTAISGSVANGQVATCWTIPTPDERTLFVSNTGNGTVSSYRINTDGSLTLLQGVASPLEGPMSGAVDGGVSEDGRYLYVMNSGLGSITAHRIESNQNLTKIQTLSGQGIPALGGEGLLVR